MLIRSFDGSSFTKLSHGSPPLSKSTLKSSVPFSAGISNCCPVRAYSPANSGSSYSPGSSPVTHIPFFSGVMPSVGSRSPAM